MPSASAAAISIPTRKARVGDTPCEYPMVLGHEPAGTVVKTGAGVTGWQPGDRAALEPALYCYHCEFCRSGHHNVCANIRFLSNPGHPGFFREFVNLPVANLLAIPPDFPWNWPPSSSRWRWQSTP